MANNKIPTSLKMPAADKKAIQESITQLNDAKKMRDFLNEVGVDTKDLDNTIAWLEKTRESLLKNFG